jgi:hypothetical protein
MTKAHPSRRALSINPAKSSKERDSRSSLATTSPSASPAAIRFNTRLETGTVEGHAGLRSSMPS